MAESVEVVVLNRQRARRVSPEGLATFLRRIARELPPQDGDQMCVCLVSDRRMRGYNRDFRGVDRATDVLAFPNDGVADPQGRVYLGDIVISVATAERQAREEGHSLARELRILALHGYLHLLGYDHEADDGTMMRLQSELSRRWLANGRTRN